MSSIGGTGSNWAAQSPYTPPTFSQLDSNSDGGISLDEFEAGAPKATSSSGASSNAAQQQQAESLFDKIDSDGDGSISSSELSAFQSKIADQRQSQQFATQLLASGQQPADDDTSGTTSGSAPAAGAHHSRHHHGGGVKAPSDGTSDGTDPTDDDALSTLEGLISGSPTSSSGADGSTANPLDLLTATNAYSSSSSATSLWSSMSNILQDAA